MVCGDFGEVQRKLDLEMKIHIVCIGCSDLELINAPDV